VGPYSLKTQAERYSKGLVAKLERCRTTVDRVRVVRAFLHEQSRKNGRQLHSGPSAPGSSLTGKPTTPPVRAGEDPKVWFRTNRFFAVDEVWFFSTRENIDVGPYVSRVEAERDARRLLEILRETESVAERRLAILQFKSRPQAGHIAY
jgi:hypothetical protein